MGLAAIHKLEPSDVSEAVLKCLRTPEICNKAREVATIIEKDRGSFERARKKVQ